MTTISVNAGAPGEELDIGRFSIGQGGLADRSTVAAHADELRNLNLKYIRLFVQEYYHVYPDHGVYDWRKLDEAVEAILAVGAQPVMCLCFKPRVLFPKLDDTVVHPESYEEWQAVVSAMVRHYNVEKKFGIQYWEVANEPDIGGGGGCPYLFTPESYILYYEKTVEAVRRADPAAKVGGPAIARSFSTPPSPAHPSGVAASPLLPAFLKAAAERNLPLDFVSWHRYSDDPEEFRKTIHYVKGLLKQHSLSCETTINEWNIGLRANQMKHHRLPEYQPCFMLDVTRIMVDEGVSSGGYWQLRNLPVRKGLLDFLGEKEAGCINAANYAHNLISVFDNQGVARPVYFAFKLLSRLTGKRIPADSEGGAQAKALATYDPDHDAIQILVWNFAVENCRPETVDLRIRLKRGVYSLVQYQLDARTTGNGEDQRLKVIDWRDYMDETDDVRETVVLEPYEVRMLRLKFRGCPSLRNAPPVAPARNPDQKDVTA
jgi:xylan 1,4-beta-xylosidase